MDKINFHANAENHALETSPTFPRLWQPDTIILAEISVVLVLAAILAPALSHFWRFANLLLFVPLAITILFLSSVTVSNMARRFKWSRAFSERISPSEAIKIITQEPNRYIVHNKYYRRRDRSRLAPAALIEDKKMEILIAVYPASVRFVDEIKNVGTEIKSY